MIDARDIIGLGEPTAGEEWWPFAGYDDALVSRWRAVASSGHTRAEWLELADAMLARWAAFRRHVELAPPRLFTGESVDG